MSPITPAIWKPATVEYSCTSCGDCCQFPSPIYLSPDEAKSLQQLNWPADSTFSQTKTIIPTKNNDGRSTFRLAKQPGSDRCVYLNGENLCAVHAAFGEAAKPAACRAFPRVFVAVGAEQFVNYSLACRCAQLVQLNQLMELIEPDVYLPIHPKATQLNLESGKAIQAAPYRDWVQGFIGFFSDSTLTTTQALAGAYRFCELTLSGDPNGESAKVLREAVAQNLPSKLQHLHVEKQMDQSQRSLFFQILYYSLNPGPVDFYEKSKLEQERIKAARLKLGEAFRDEFNAPLILNQPLQCTFQEIRMIPCGIPDENLKQTIGAFLCTKLVGLRFHSDNAQPFTTSVHLLLLACAEILWLAKAFSAQEQAVEPDAELHQPTGFNQMHLEQAIRLIDSSIGTLSISMFPKNVAEAWRVLFGETTFALTAFSELLSSGGQRNP